MAKNKLTEWYVLSDALIEGKTNRWGLARKENVVLDLYSSSLHESRARYQKVAPLKHTFKTRAAARAAKKANHYILDFLDGAIVR